MNSRSAPGARLLSDAHSPGCREHLTILEGRLAVTSSAATELLGPGDVARYPADRTYAIAAEDDPARAILIVQDSLTCGSGGFHTPRTPRGIFAPI